MLMQICRTDLKMLAMSLNSRKNFTQDSHFSDVILNLLNTTELLLERCKTYWSYLALNSRKNFTQDNCPSNMVFNLSSTSELPLQITGLMENIPKSIAKVDLVSCLHS
jgi:hypothetical protein